VAAAALFAPQRRAGDQPSDDGKVPLPGAFRRRRMRRTGGRVSSTTYNA